MAVLGVSFRDGKMCIHKAFRRFLSRVSLVIFPSTTGDWSKEMQKLGRSSGTAGI